MIALELIGISKALALFKPTMTFTCPFARAAFMASSAKTAPAKAPDVDHL